MDGYVVAEVWVLVDEDGNSVASHDREKLKELYEDEVGELGGQCTRIIRATINVPTPRHVDLIGVVPDEASGGELKVA